MKKALLTGITGQDGSYLAEILLEKGYLVHGIIRRTSTSSTSRIAHLLEHGSLFLHEGDLGDSSNLQRLIEEIMPDEIYNLAAQSHVKTSFELPEFTTEVNAVGVLRLLEAVRKIKPTCKFYQASTSELFGKVQTTPQNEKTPFYPRSPYGFSKLYAYWAVVNYRESYNLFACNGILFNHESPRRGKEFVSRKITLGVAKIKQGLQEKLLLGNLDARRDWGYAKDFVYGMYLMLQQEKPDDYVLATGKTQTVRSFVERAFSEVEMDIVWQGKGITEKGIDRKSDKVVVEISPEFFRPAEVDLLIGDPSKAKEKLGWQAQTSIEELVEMMVREDIKAYENCPCP
ncbi:MAG TPA: GDP-mannose 4,6-dehydratase [Chlamydiales bacterium]|nr:GDP-mannose 4,6-dehydratase [Chlamydiales bacterium]